MDRELGTRVLVAPMRNLVISRCKEAPTQVKRFMILLKGKWTQQNGKQKVWLCLHAGPLLWKGGAGAQN